MGVTSTLARLSCHLPKSYTQIKKLLPGNLYRQKWYMSHLVCPDSKEVQPAELTEV